MKRLSALLLLGAALAFAQDHHQMVNEHGDRVMGFSHEKITHHFELSYNGGCIDFRYYEMNDTQSRDEIRAAFPAHRPGMFAEGNFNAPMLIHNREDVPGTTVMSRLKDQLHWTMSETSRGARLTVIADNRPALDAVHQFLRFQIEDHQTGDCPMVH